ncbi:MAG: TonB-dependent receptor [bacterium]|nr:TonB-dependent receptor [bacterium]
MDAQALSRLAFCTMLALGISTRADDDPTPFVTLPEVLIQSTGSGVVRAIGREEIRKCGARDAAGVLDLISGIALRFDAASGGKVFARVGGSNVNQVIVLVDGVRYDDVGSGEADLSRIPAEWIESIEIRQGGGANGSAIGGVISIETITPVEKSMKIQAASSATDGSLMFMQKWSNKEVSAVAGIIREQGSGRYRYRITEEDGNGEFTENLGQEFRRENNQSIRDWILGKLESTVGGGRLRASVQTDRVEFGVPGYLAPRPTPQATQDELFRIAQASYTKIGQLGHVGIVLAAQEQHKEYRDPDPYSFLHESQESAERLTASATWRRTVLGTSLSAESRTERERLSSGLLENNSAERTRWQAALDGVRALDIDALKRHRLHFSAGLNIERFGDAQLESLPRAELSYAFSGKPTCATGVRYSESYLAPTFYSLFWNDEVLAQGNPNLRPESGEMWQIFARASTRGRLKTSVDINAARNRIDDLIYWRQAFDGRWTPQNLKRARIESLSCSMRQQLVADLLACRASMEWLEARDRSGERTTDGKYLIYRPMRTARAGLDANWTGVTGMVQVRWSDRQAVLETNSKWLPAYTVVDAEARKSVTWRENEIEFGVRCENVFDVDYRLVRHAPMPLRQIWVTASLRIGA